MLPLRLLVPLVLIVPALVFVGLVLSVLPCPALVGIALGGKACQPGPQPLQTCAKQVGAEGQIEAQLHRAPGPAQGTVPGLAISPAPGLAFSLAVDRLGPIAVVVVRRQGAQQALLVPPPLPLLAGLQLGGQAHQLLNREQAVAPLH